MVCELLGPSHVFQNVASMIHPALFPVAGVSTRTFLLTCVARSPFSGASQSHHIKRWLKVLISSCGIWTCTYWETNSLTQDLRELSHTKASMHISRLSKWEPQTGRIKNKRWKSAQRAADFCPPTSASCSLNELWTTLESPSFDWLFLQ